MGSSRRSLAADSSARLNEGNCRHAAGVSHVMVAPHSAPPVTLFWRPGCPYCARLRRELRSIGLETTEVNIWDDPSGAAIVRSFAAGNETVPTVVVGDTGLVNPSATTVLDAVRAAVPDLVDDRLFARARRRRGLLLGQRIALSLVVLASLAAEASRHARISWAFGGLALVAFVGFRVARGRDAARGEASTAAGGLHDAARARGASTATLIAPRGPKMIDNAFRARRVRRAGCPWWSRAWSDRARSRR